MRIFRCALALPAPGGTGLAVPEVHDVHGGLMPPVEHEHHQDVPQLMAGSKVVHLTCSGGKGPCVFWKQLKKKKGTATKQNWFLLINELVTSELNSMHMLGDIERSETNIFIIKISIRIFSEITRRKYEKRSHCFGTETKTELKNLHETECPMEKHQQRASLQALASFVSKLTRSTESCSSLNGH